MKKDNDKNIQIINDSLLNNILSKEDKIKSNIILLDEEGEKSLEKENVYDKQNVVKQNNAKDLNKLNTIKQKLKNKFLLKLNPSIKAGGTKIETDSIISSKLNVGGNQCLFSFDKKDIAENNVCELTTNLLNFDISKNDTTINTTSKDKFVDIFYDKNESKNKTGLCEKKRYRDDKHSYNEDLQDSDNEDLQDSVNDEAKNKMEGVGKKDQQGV